MIKIERSRSGLPFARTERIRIHSAYDPLKEAEIFIRKMDLDNPGTVVILGPGLGYITDNLKTGFAGLKIVSIHFSEILYCKTKDKNSPSWHPESSQSLNAFLRANISTFDIEGLKLIEWPPSAAAFPEVSKKANRVLNQLIREINGTLMTTSKFGKKWISNSIKNMIYSERYISGMTVNRPVLIAASGASLSASFELIKEIRENILLWALPSSVQALLYAGIQPDLIIQTDPGYYASLHLRVPDNIDIPIARPLSAVRGDENSRQPILLLSNSAFFEKAFIDALGLPAVVLPPNGTVAGTAVTLAMLKNTYPVFLAGLDLCYNDIQAHVRPHSFDTLIAERTSRLKPEVGTLYSRTASLSPGAGQDGIRTSLSMTTYSGWFREIGKSSQKRLFRINPSQVKLEGIPTITKGEIRKYLDKTQFPDSPDRNNMFQEIPDIKDRISTAAKIVEGWKEKLLVLKSNRLTAESFKKHLDNPILFSLLFYIDLPDLIETRKKLRKAKPESAQEAAGPLIEKSIRYITELGRRINRI